MVVEVAARVLAAEVVVVEAAETKGIAEVAEATHPATAIIIADPQVLLCSD